MLLFTDLIQRANPRFPIVDSNDVKGGLWTVNSTAELEELQQNNSPKLKLGTLAYVTSLDVYYLWKNGAWSLAQLGSSGNSGSFNSVSGIPILTELIYNELLDKPSEYIQIQNTPINPIKSSDQLEVMFQAIRKLQAEVAKINNSFKYGINSFTEGSTAMSSMLGTNSNTPDEEPLWALEEEDLIPQLGATLSIDYDHVLEPSSSVVYNTSEDYVLKIKDKAYYNDGPEGFKSITDPKTIVYITSSKLDITFTFNTGLEINLRNLTNKTSDLYNIMLVLSKLVASTENQLLLYGYNYLWIQITDVKTNRLLISGYYSNGTLHTSLTDLPEISYIEKVMFEGLEQDMLHLYKFNSYSKYLDFSYNVIPSVPLENEYKLGVAHLTIRSASSLSVLDGVQNQLLDNELIWVEDSKKLCIKSKGKIYNIGSINEDDNDDNTMSIDELIANLRNLGIVTTEVGTNSDGTTNYELKLSDLTGVTFIHQDTGKKFDITVDSEGNFRSLQLLDSNLEDELKELNSIFTNSDNSKTFYKVGPDGNYTDGLPTKVNNGYSEQRGFIGNLRTVQSNKFTTNSHDSDVGINSDRLKIGAVYAPDPNISVYGCSHAYIELENTSDKDINLEGCTLNYRIGTAQKDADDKTVYVTLGNTYTLPLTGTIKAGGTYLIRGKQYANFDDVNTIIKVKTFDQEWYHNGELIDLQQEAISFVLLYMIPVQENIVYYNSSAKDNKACKPEFIDGMSIRGNVLKIDSSNNKTSWLNSFSLPSGLPEGRDYIIKNTFELDPAKQAFQSLAPSKKDSSRVRGATLNDFKLFYIDKPIISFPNSDPTYDVSMITPKASFENKNISTDKTKLNKDRPNMVYCSFGIDTYKTRCFNWISVGSFDEYIWVREKGTNEWERFESYKGNSGEQSGTKFKRKNPGYVKMTSTGATWQNTSDDDFTIPVEPYVYARTLGRFPGDNSFYTAHKCILESIEYVNAKTKYEYIVGRALVDGTPDPEHTSTAQEFTLYRQGTLPKVYHITDLQGFYWIEYQTWAGAAKALAKKIEEDTETMPVIINTGDVTLNGTRINEWLDYYLAGYDLFKQFEHMSVVGNNDLCGTDPSILGTGDDTGKSNSYYHHLFNCYEIQDNLLVYDGTTYKYIPSTYYFDAGDIRFVNLNSEITFINCRDWFNLKVYVDNNLDNDISYNIYTGWQVLNKTKDTHTLEYYKGNNFIPVYNHLKKWFSSGKKCIASCHEIPFTVMTFENLMYPKTTSDGTLSRSRSTDIKSGSLVGSHLNQLTKADNCCHNWFSRLLESSGVKLCLGGHKHTYTCTFPTREFYYYPSSSGSLTNSYIAGPMTMPDTLEEDINTIWQLPDEFFSDSNFKLLTTGTFNSTGQYFLDGEKGKGIHTSRLPLVSYGSNPFESKNLYGKDKESEGTVYDVNNRSEGYLPSIKDDSTYSNKSVVYFMCLATGYKQTSNKELPGFAQTFSKVLPFSITKDDDKGNLKTTASKDLQVPMFAEVVIDSNKNYQLFLSRINGIQSQKAKPLYTDNFSNSNPTFEYLSLEGSRYGLWKSESTHIMSNTL